jgi:hypothetical protein
MMLLNLEANSENSGANRQADKQIRAKGIDGFGLAGCQIGPTVSYWSGACAPLAS